MDEFIIVMPKGNKKQKVVSYYCNLCKNCFVDVKLHVNGAKHQRLHEVEDVLPTLQVSGIGMFISLVHCE